MPGEVVAVVAVFWLFSLIVARLDGERIGYWKGEAAAAKRQREAIEHVLATGAERATEQGDEGPAMKRYVKYRQACNCDAEPMPSMRTARAEGDGDYAGLTVLFYPQVCSGCKTPYREGQVMREVD